MSERLAPTRHALKDACKLVASQRAIVVLAAVLRDQLDQGNEDGSWAVSYAIEQLADGSLPTVEHLQNWIEQAQAEEGAR